MRFAQGSQGVSDDMTFKTIGDLKEAFQGITDSKTLALYIFSVAYLPLRTLGYRREAACSFVKNATLSKYRY